MYVPPPPSVGGWSPAVVSNGQTLASQMLVQVGGSTLTVVRVAASAKLHLVVGTKDGGSGRMPDGVVPHAIFSFNGGFDLAEAGSTVTGLQAPGINRGQFPGGAAAIVGYADGGFGMGQWGRDVPAPGRPLAWARSNLQLLVDGGAPTPQSGDPGLWGLPLSSVGMNTARSAVGVDASGNLLVVLSQATYPQSLAQAMVAGGAVRAMELDINPWWVMGWSYSAGTPQRLYANPNHPDYKFNGWERDFFVAATV